MESDDRFTPEKIEAMLSGDGQSVEKGSLKTCVPRVPSPAFFLSVIICLALWGLFFWWLRS